MNNQETSKKLEPHYDPSETELLRSLGTRVLTPLNQKPVFRYPPFPNGYKAECFKQPLPENIPIVLEDSGIWDQPETWTQVGVVKNLRLTDKALMGDFYLDDDLTLRNNQTVIAKGYAGNESIEVIAAVITPKKNSIWKKDHSLLGRFWLYY